MKEDRVDVSFDSLVRSIQQIHDTLSAQASRAVNVSLTLRNWLMGCYIAEYELQGKDRAEYGDGLLEELSRELSKLNVRACNHRQLYHYVRFYQVYPQILRSVTAKLQNIVPKRLMENLVRSDFDPKEGQIEPQTIVEKLSYTHIEQLIGIEDDTKRAFYEMECIRGNWSVRELKRQIGSLYYERSGLSTNKEKLAELAERDAEQTDGKLVIRDPYIFEFLGLKPAEVMGESQLEDQLLDKMQEFLLELGHGFCFEARQKRILIGDEHFFVDLAFYHRILKCHVLVELKLGAFSQENIGQLNTYVSWYKKNMMSEGDNPPVGVLLCTDKNHALVEYALAGMDNQLFVSKYMLELPKKEDMQAFMDRQLKELS